MKSIIGKKIGMTQIFSDDGRIFPVTVIEAGPCRVIQLKTAEKDGYTACQIGFDEIKKEKKVTKGRLGHFKKVSMPPYRFLKEVQLDEIDLKIGDHIAVDIFSKGDTVSVSGISRGKGFQGVMKRHNYKGGPGSHGSMFNRAPGSIGQSSFPSRVFKNKGMPGQMGNEKVTVRNIEVVEVKKDQNLLLLKGAVPGSSGGYLVIKSQSPVAAKSEK